MLAYNTKQKLKAKRYEAIYLQLDRHNIKGINEHAIYVWMASQWTCRQCMTQYGRAINMHLL